MRRLHAQALLGGAVSRTARRHAVAEPGTQLAERNDRGLRGCVENVEEEHHPNRLVVDMTARSEADADTAGSLGLHPDRLRGRMDVSWPAFLGVVMLAYCVPGPDFAVILRSGTRGARAGWAAAAGAQLGLCVHMLLAVVGISTLLAAHPGALVAVRLAGGAYLLYLGGRLVVGSFRRPLTPDDAPEAPQAFRAGLLTNLTNPKAVLFFASVLPQFVESSGSPVWLQVLVLGAVDVGLGFLPWSVVIALGAGLSGWLGTEAVRRWWDRLTGTVLAGLGGTLLAKG
jgi:threonine/homoserine/homoserine lactone efflux protein